MEKKTQVFLSVLLFVSTISSAFSFAAPSSKTCRQTLGQMRSPFLEAISKNPEMLDLYDDINERITELDGRRNAVAMVSNKWDRFFAKVHRYVPVFRIPLLDHPNFDRVHIIQELAEVEPQLRELEYEREGLENQMRMTPGEGGIDWHFIHLFEKAIFYGLSELFGRGFSISIEVFRSKDLRPVAIQNGQDWIFELKARVEADDRKPLDPDLKNLI